jgi:hypothetical protein
MKNLLMIFAVFIVRNYFSQDKKRIDSLFEQSKEYFIFEGIMEEPDSTHPYPFKLNSHSEEPFCFTFKITPLVCYSSKRFSTDAGFWQSVDSAVSDSENNRQITYSINKKLLIHYYTWSFDSKYWPIGVGQKYFFFCVEGTEWGMFGWNKNTNWREDDVIVAWPETEKYLLKKAKENHWYRIVREEK